MGLFDSILGKKSEETIDDNIKDEKVDFTNETEIEENKDQKQEVNCNEIDEQSKEIEDDKLDDSKVQAYEQSSHIKDNKCINTQGQANEISEIRDEMEKIRQCLENVIETNTILNKKLVIQQSKFNQNIEELKRVIIEEKNEEILNLKREIKAKENKEIADAKNIINIVDQLDSIYNHAVEIGNNPLIENLNFTMKIIKKELSEMGIEEISALGEQISSTYHINENIIIDETKDSNEIVEIIKKGYVKNGDVLRKATVSVAK